MAPIRGENSILYSEIYADGYKSRKSGMNDTQEFLARWNFMQI